MEKWWPRTSRVVGLEDHLPFKTWPFYLYVHGTVSFRGCVKVNFCFFFEGFWSKLIRICFFLGASSAF